jgi:hypothetical protein
MARRRHGAIASAPPLAAQLPEDAIAMLALPVPMPGNGQKTVA